jgi:hypothetical protein
LKITIESAPEPPPTCGTWPSKRSTARCEQRPGHWDNGHPDALIHAGRTRGGYWKFWAVTDEEKTGDA